MKPTSILEVAVLALALCLPGQAIAATITKANNTNNLDLTASWNGGVVPSTNDVAKWDSSVTGALTNALGSSLTFGGIAVSNPGGSVRIAAGNTITLGSFGIDLGSSTQGLAIVSTLALLPGAGQTWNVAPGLTLSTSAFTAGAGSFLMFNRASGAGSLAASPTLANSIVGPWAVVRSGGAAAFLSTNGFTYATVSTGSIVPYTGATTNANFAWPTSGASTVNYDIAGTNGGVVGSTRVANTVRYIGGANTQPYGSGTNMTLTLSGLMNAGTGALTLAQYTGSVLGRLAVGTNNGNQLTLVAGSAALNIAIPIINGSGGAGSVVVAGPNEVTLTATNTYSGQTYIGGGSLALSGSATINSSAGITLNGAGTRLRQNSAVASTVPIALKRGTIEGIGTLGAVTVGNNSGGIVSNGNSNSATLTLGSLTFDGAGAFSLNWSGASPAVAVSGALATTPANGPVTVNVAAGSIPNGTNDLVSFGSFAGSASDFTVGTVSGLGPRQTASGLVLNGNNIALVVSGLDIVWTGATSAAWTTNAVGGSGNWAVGTNATEFLSGDNVVFNDSASGNTSLDISTATIAPGVVTFSNSALNYMIGSTGGHGIAGGASLVKSGNGTLTISTSNSFAGSTTLNGGRLNLGTATSLGSGGITVNGGSIDNTSGGALAFTSNPAQAWNADFIFGGSSDLNMGNGRVTLGGTGATRTVNVPAGTLTVGGIVGTNYGLTKSGNGTLTLNPTVLSGNAGSAVGALEVSAGTLNIGAYDMSATSLAGSGTLANGSATSRWLVLSNASDNTFSGSLQNGAGAGRLGLSKSGNGTLTLSGSNAFTDTLTASGGSVILTGTNTLGGLNVGGILTFASGSSSAATGGVNVGAAAGVAVLNIGGSTAITVPSANYNFLVGNAGANSSGVVNHDGGSVILAATNNFVLGGATNGYALYKLSAGTLTQSSVTTDKVVRIGQTMGSNAFALFKQTGGALNSGTGFAINDVNGGTGTGGYACVYVSGGRMASTATNVGLGIAGRAGQAEVTVAGSGQIDVTNTVLGYSVRTSSAGDGVRTGILNLGTGSPGGTLVTASVGKSAGGTNYAYMSFNGGTLKAAANSATFLGGLDVATVYAGGATIDNNGKAIDISQSLVAPSGDGVASISAVGGGYVGSPYVQITGGGGAGASAVAHIDAGGNITSVTVTSPGFGYTSAPAVALMGGGGTGSASAVVGPQASGDVNLIGSGTTTLSGASAYTNTTFVGGGLWLSGSVAGDVVARAGSVVGGSGAAAGRLTFETNATVYVDAFGSFVTASNGVTIAGPTQILFNNTPINGVPYILFGYGSGSVTGTNLLVSPYRVEIADDSANKVIVATPTIGDISWSTGNGVWTNAGGTNWSGGGAFYAGDTVTFTNSPVSASVSIQGQVLPGSILVDAATDYSFTGLGGITGATALTKSGTGTVALATSNSYAGGTTLNAGQLNIDSAHALGSGALTINGGAIDNKSGGALVLATSNAQVWNGDFAFVGTDDLNLAPGAVTIGGTNDRVVTLGNGKTLTVGKITSAFYGLALAGSGTLTIKPPAAYPAGDSSIAGLLNVGAGATLRFNTGTNAATTADMHVGGLTGSGMVINGGGVERWFWDADNTGLTFTGSLQDGGAGAIGFIKSGTGTTVLAGSNSVSGRFTAGGGGTLVIAGPNSSTNYGYASIEANSTLVLAHTNALGAQRLVRFNGSSSSLVLQTDVPGVENNVTLGTTTTATIVADRSTPGAAITHYVSTETNNNGLGGGSLTVVAGPNVTGGMPRVVFPQFNLGAGSVQTTVIAPTTANVTIGNSWKANNNFSQTLGLGGTSSDNYVTGTIANGTVLTGANAISVAKSDSSTWYLTGTNTYTGPTMVAGGSLFINGNNSAATGSVSVSAATLGGSGSIGGSVVLSSGTITPGADATNVGTLTILGSLAVDVASAAVFRLGGSGLNDAISAAGGSTLYGTIEVELAPGYTPASGDTFDLFAGAISGSPALSLPALSGGNAWVTNDFLASGVISVTNTNTPTPTNAYALWLTNYPGVGAYTNATDDPDGDGFDNGSEFAFDGNPTAGTAALFKASKSGTNIVFTFVANNSAFPTNYAVLSAANLKTGPFETNAAATATVSNSADQSGLLLSNDYTRKEFTVPVSTTSEYFRVRAVLP